ncbi:hypothetical protein GCM10022381_29800 [Leifsonia kafniensis]|uniref:Uncharacterized protein n=1 Tax=Leifsonia kafniensis TaxID=475957 RepID=A0ABP7KQV3_9MICO
MSTRSATATIPPRTSRLRPDFAPSTGVAGAAGVVIFTTGCDGATAAGEVTTGAADAAGAAGTPGVEEAGEVAGALAAAAGRGIP